MSEITVSEQHKQAIELHQKIIVSANLAQQNIWDMCNGLKTMRDNKLYKELGYQNFEDYCENEVGMKRSNAYNYISIVEKINPENVQSIGQIGMTKLALLATISEPEQAEIAEKLDLENTTVKQLKAEIDSLKAEKQEATDKSIDYCRQLNNAKKDADYYKQQADTSKESYRNIENQLAEEKNKNFKLTNKVQELESRPIEVAVAEPSDNERRLNETIKALERENIKHYDELEEEYRKHNAKKFGKRFKTINSKVEEMIRTAKADGNASQEAEILEAVKDGFKAPKKPSAHSTAEFFKVNDRKLDALIKSTTDDLKRAETAVLRMSNDKYRKAIFNAQVAMNTGAVTYEKAVDIACKDMLNAGLNCVEYKNGARHTLSDYADMAVKTANKRAYLRGEGEKRAEWGMSLVVVNSRQGGCPDCAKYIGKVFIDDVYSNGKKSNGNYPLLSTAIKNGLFHPRCKDSTSTYYEEITTLEPVSPEEEAEMDRRERLEEKQQYAQRQAERFDRRAEYSLDEDNKRIAQTRADEWHDRADMLEEKAKQFSLKTDEQKYYRPVFKEDISKTFERKIEGETITIDTRKANTLCDNVYISDKVKLKRKELHDFDMQVRKAFDMLGEVETSGKPDICIISPEEMRVNAIASYMPMQNVLNVNSAYFSTSDLSDLQENLACPQDGLSTILHELIHWQDAKSYRAKFGGINDYFEYCDYLNKIYAPKVEKLINNGYNIEDISEYAFECLKDKAMDEVYNEYRVSKLLG